MTACQISPRLVICGTDTDVGKTVVSALFVQGFGALYWKPVQSGLEGGGDRGRLCRWLNLPESRTLPEAYALQAPVSPHWAAEREQTHIDPKALALPLHAPLVIETAGGLMVPLNRQWLQLDQLEHWNLPVILVARSSLGTINHTLLSLEALHRRHLPVVGLVLNGPAHHDNRRTIVEFGGVPVLTELLPLPHLSAESLGHHWQQEKLGLVVMRRLSYLSKNQ